jgi:hypothetical protein
MSDEDKHEQQDEPEQSDLEVSEEQAEEVEGGLARVRFGADRDPQAWTVK